MKWESIVTERIQQNHKDRHTFLDLSGLRMDNLPDSLFELDHLLELDISYNRLLGIDSRISRLNRLQFLNAQGNQIMTINFDYGEYYCLKELNLSDNWLADLPLSLENLVNLQEFDFTGNPVFVRIPEEIQEQGVEAMVSFIEQTRVYNSTTKIYEAKLVTVGQGDVGKTTLIKSMVDNNYTFEQGKEKTTLGLKIYQWQTNCLFDYREDYYEYFARTFYENEYEEGEDDFDEEGGDEYELKVQSVNLSEKVEIELAEYGNGDLKNVQLNVWDFGGQEIYHSTHQFFLTKRSFYLLVWEARKEENIQIFDYWLNVLKYLTKSSPVLIVMNKSDVRTQNIDEDILKTKFPNILGFLNVSCATREGIYDLIKELKISIPAKIPHLGDRLPKVWVNIKYHLQEHKKNYIDRDEFLDICYGYDLPEILALQLSDYLHDIGTILFFRDDSYLENYVILNPHWLTDAFYSLIDSESIRSNYGEFSVSTLRNIWTREIYPFESHQLITRLLERFELCFNLTNSDKYIIPSLLRDSRPDYNFGEFHISSFLTMAYNYKFLPAGVMGRLICRLHHLIPNKVFWKNGLVIHYENSQVLITLDVIEKQITLTAVGSDRKEGLTIVKNELDQINESLNLTKGQEVIIEILCGCGRGKMFNYTSLKKFESKGVPQIPCDVCFENLNISEVLNGYNLKSASHKLLKDLVFAITKLQGNMKSLRNDEDSMNSYVSTILDSKGYISRDQARWGKSETGVRSGELDIKIETKDGLDSIFEGVKLTTFNTTKITSHLDKLFNYDPNGLSNNYLVLYCFSSKFNFLCSKYFDFVKEYEFEFELTNIQDFSNSYSQASGIRVYTTSHSRNGRPTKLNHILVHLRD